MQFSNRYVESDRVFGYYDYWPTGDGGHPKTGTIALDIFEEADRYTLKD